MNCPICGAPLPPNASFCPSCGHNLRQQSVSINIPGQPTSPHPSNASDGRPRPPFEQDEPTSNETHQPTLNESDTDPRESAPRQPEGYYHDASHPQGAADQRDGQSNEPSHKLGGGAKAAIVVAVIMLLLVSLGIGLLFVSFMGNFGTRVTQSTHPVTFVVSIPDYDKESSRIPVHLTGMDINGDAVDRTIYLAHSGVDVELLKGRYHAEVVGSPISSTGMIYEIPTSTINFTLGEDLDPDEGYRMPSSLALVFTPIDDQNMTDQKIEDALSWARKDEEAGLDIGKLEAAAKSRQQRGIEESTNSEPQPQEEERPAPEAGPAPEGEPEAEAAPTPEGKPESETTQKGESTPTPAPEETPASDESPAPEGEPETEPAPEGESASEGESTPEEAPAP